MPVAERRARAWILLIITVILALLAGSVVFALLGRGPAWLTGRTPPGDVVGAPSLRPDLAGAVGVNLDRSELAAPELPQRLAELAAANVRWVRLRLPWDEIEPARGQYQWAAWDRIMAALAAQPQLQPLLVLDGAPAWARPAADAANPLAPPQTRADFGAFAGAVARRYGGQVRYYQVWDEPNIAPHWGARPVDAAGYVGLLREAAVNLRAADPDAQIVLAALAPNGEPGGANQSDAAFLDGVYAAGGRPWFDIAAGEPYGFSQAPGAAPDLGALNFGRAALLRDVMVRRGDAGTPLWATAFGWNALPQGYAGPRSPWDQVSEAEQARYAAEALALARARWPWLGALFWAADCPPPPAGSAGAAEAAGPSGGSTAPRAADDPWRGFALCGPDGARRPAWQALRAAAAAPPILPPGSHAMDHPALQYSPGWRVTPDAADPHANGDRLSFTFYGSDLALRIQGGPFWAYDRITVDGQPANALPRDEGGAAYLALADPLAETRTVTVARNLPLGEHRAELEANGGWDQWALRGVLVESARPALLASGRQAGLWLGLLALLAAGAWLAVAWPWRATAGGWLGQAGAWADNLPAALTWGAVAVLGAVFLLARGQALGLLALAALAVVFLLQPAAMLPLIAASIPFWPQPRVVVRWQFAPYELLLWTGAAALALRWLVLAGRHGDARGTPPIAAQVRRPGGGAVAWLRGHGAARGITGLDWPVLALVLVGLAASLTAQRVGVALREYRMVFLDAGLFYLLITRLLDVCRPAWLGVGARRAPAPAIWPLLDGLLSGMACVSVLALGQLATGQGRIDVEGVWRVRAFYGSPNNLALVLDRVVPLALAVALFTPAAGPARLRRWPYAAAAILMAAACLATFSKGALLLGLPAGVGLVVLGGAWRARRRWPLALLAAVGAAALAGLGLLFQTQRFAGLTNFQAGTSFIRLKLWQGALHMALDHPWLGVGPDNFLYAYRTRYVLPGAWEELNLSHPHNILLDLWTRLGLAGLAAGAWALVAGILGAWALFRRGGRATWPLALGLLGGLAATVAHGLIDNSLFLIDLMALFMLALGVVQALRAGAQADG